MSKSFNLHKDKKDISYTVTVHGKWVQTEIKASNCLLQKDHLEIYWTRNTLMDKEMRY